VYYRNDSFDLVIVFDMIEICFNFL